MKLTGRVSWVEVKKHATWPANIVRSWSLMMDNNTAAAMVVEADDGQFVAVFTSAGSPIPSVKNGLPTEVEAKRIAEEMVATHLFTPKTVLFNA